MKARTDEVTSQAEENKKKNFKSSRTKTIVYIALFVALNVVCAQITVPSVIPFTMQVFGVFITLGLLGGKKGTLTVLCYILLGLVGVPVFNGFRGGIGVLSGVTGGYIVGFIFSALCYWGITALGKNKFPFKAMGMFIGLIVCYAFGTGWFVIVKGNSGSPVDFVGALTVCVAPFAVFDTVKILLALFLTRVLERHLKL